VKYGTKGTRRPWRVLDERYIISGKVGEFQGLVQITNPVVTTIGPTNLPDVLDISQYSLDFEDITYYEGYVVN